MNDDTNYNYGIEGITAKKRLLIKDCAKFEKVLKLNIVSNPIFKGSELIRIYLNISPRAAIIFVNVYFSRRGSSGSSGIFTVRTMWHKDEDDRLPLSYIRYIVSKLECEYHDKYFN